MYLECTFPLERCGFCVTCVTLDGHSVNRRFFKLLGASSSSESKFNVNNPLSFNQRKVFFISDPPHLIKTTRNCLANPKRNMQVIFTSYMYVHIVFTKCTLCIQINGHRISWEFITKLYEISTHSDGLTTLHKLKYELELADIEILKVI